MTYVEIRTLLERLRDLDEISLIEALGLTSSDIVDCCIDRIIEKQGKLIEFYVEDK